MVERRKYIRVHCHSGPCGHPKISQYKVMHLWVKMIEELPGQALKRRLSDLPKASLALCFIFLVL